MKDKLIEWDLPLAEISEESAREKNIRHGHPSTLHIWWARRPLAASRATAFAALMDDPKDSDEREELLELIREITPWEAVKDGNSPAIEEARRRVLEQFDGKPPKVLDPFAGGGSIPLEALRLGCETYASDYNPVAVFIEKATLEWPQKYGIEVELPEEEVGKDDQLSGFAAGEKVNLLAYLVEKWANRVLEEAREEIGQFYPTEDGSRLVGKREITETEGWTPVGYLWARTVPCQNPSCGAEIPLIRQYWLARKKNKRIAYRPVVDREAKRVEFEILQGKELEEAQEQGFDPKDGTVYRANAECLVCGQVTKAERVRELAREGEMGERMVAAVFHHPDEVGKKYRLATDEDRRVFEEAAEYLGQKLEQWPYLESALPVENITKNSRYMVPTTYGFHEWQALFNIRQRLALVTFMESIRDSCEQIESECRKLVRDSEREADTLNPERLADTVTAFLAIIFDRTVDKNSSLARWNNIGEKIEATFGRQALPMMWDYVELNVFSGVNGDWTSNREWVLRYIDNNRWSTLTDPHVNQASATDLPHPDDYFDAILTDPPYYDNVPYAALSDFFYVWLKRAAGEQFPELFGTPLVPTSDEAIMEPDRHDSSEEAKHFFEEMLADSFREIHRVLKPGGITLIVYAHKTTAGWETMLNSLVVAGLVVSGSWPVHTEKRGRLRSAQSAALASSIYMVCRKQERMQLGFWEEIRPRVKAQVEKKLNHFWNQGLIRGGDFFISAIGPGMEAYSEYEEVRTYDDRSFAVEDLLQFIRGVATDFLVNRLLKDASAEAIDQAAQFYLTYRWTFGDNEVEFDDARRIATAEGVDLEELDGGFVNVARKNVHVYGPQDRDAIEDVENMVDAMHQACQLWAQERHEQLGQFLQNGGYGQRHAFWQFCQAVAECHPNGGKEKQWLEGLLMAEGRYRKGDGTRSSVESQTEMELD